ncbi:MAG: TIM barrel protein [archaeon]|nr:MAG: TIM barrel protein [archaeon]
MKILLGPAGIPLTAKGEGNPEGVRKVRELGFGAMEVEFTHGIQMENELAKEVGRAQKETKVKLSVHSPYFINLASAEPKKIKASKARILQSCERAHYMNASPVVFHPGFYGNYTPQETFDFIKKGILEITDKIREKGWSLSIAPETTGKVSQFGTLDELLLLLKEIKDKNCTLCLDFAHMWARYHGKVDYNEVMKKVKKLGHIHSHFSQIAYGEKGERNHMTFSESREKSPPVEGVCKAILASRQDITIISESPVLEQDSMKMKKIFEKLGHKF